MSPSLPDQHPLQADAAAVQRHFMFTLGQVNKQWRRTLDRLLAPMGLTQALWMPLMHLARSPEAMRQKDLAHSLALDSSSVVRLVDGLAAQGWIERVDDSDRRVKKIQLTAAGHAQVEAVQDLLQQARAQVLGAVPPEELDAAYATLHRLLDAMGNASCLDDDAAA
ncbi:Salmolysin [Delftia tsuruhatensis]|uniref:MarR family winged helix-turn-helix transcriptional regulator n=1 Tax=Delftia tsuruhatensis TaxID=180282 RepID=UPI001E8035A9|nr:MarR family transcriptional regulator [Delftia tsuruhatensis]CAB5719113.1 Salmolysin [Delftia tsuruhatensis]CAC9687741.1 Salmolysin [Delftia tsuruhatensis]